MKTGIVLVNYNDFNNTQKFINNIINYKIIDKIVVVDNNSTDDSLLKLDKLKNKKIEIIKNKNNEGYASGINLGSKYLISKYNKCNIIVSNTDIIINSESDISKLLNDFKQKNIAIVAPIIKERNGMNRGWKIPSPIQDSILNLPYIHKFLRPKMLYYSEEYYKNKIVNIEVVSGCFFIIKSEALEKINFLDVNTFLYYEENILSTKLKSKNYKIIIDTQISVIHNHSITIDKNIKRINKYKILKKSQLYFQKKYNRATICDIIFLEVTSKITLILLYVVTFIQGGLKNERNNTCWRKRDKALSNDTSNK